MSESTLRNYAIGIIIFATLLTGGMAFINILMSNNSQHISPDDPYYEAFTNDLDIYDDSVGMGEDIEDSVEDVDGEGGGDGSFLDSLFGGSWKTIQNFGRQVSFMDDVFDSTVRLFGLPWWISSTIIAIIGTMIVFAIYTAIFQRRL